MNKILLPAVYNRLTQYERKIVREKYQEVQGNLCHYCKSNLDAPPPIHVQAMEVNWTFSEEDLKRHPIHLHHNHATGITVGAVHAHCNAILFQYYHE